MIEILHLATGFGRGGAELNVARLVSKMDASRFSNTVVSMRRRYDPWMVQRLTKTGIPFKCLEMRAGIPDPRAIVRLLQIVRKTRPQVLQTWLYHADLLGLLVGKLARVPVIIWNVQNSLLKNRWMSSLVLRVLVPLSGLPNAVFSNSQAGIRVHRELGYKPKKWVWVPNLLDLNEFRPEPEAQKRLRQALQLPFDTFLVGLVARFDPVKDHSNFIRAGAFMSSENPNIHFVLVGQGLDSTNEHLMSMLREAGVENRFHLLGLRDDVSRITAGFDLACSSSLSEGTPGSVAEAMACGVPCVVTDVGDSALLVGNTGKVVPPRDPRAFANACLELIALSPLCRSALGAGARERVVRDFSMEATVARYEELYQHFAGKSAKGFRH